MKVFAICLELVGIATIGTGIGLEIALGGSGYLVVITAGSCLVAAGGVVFGKFLRGGRGAEG